MEAQIHHRAALEHVLGLIAAAPWSAGLVLRGSMLMTAWCGDTARPPADLDFIAVDDARPVDAMDPYPHVELEFVQQWPEVADGAGRYEMWLSEEFDTGGQKPRVPPEGLQWVTDEDWSPSSPYGDLIDRIRREPEAGHGVRLDADEAREHSSWTYAYFTMAGTRLVVPWEAEAGGLKGRVQVDFAQDEVLPEVPTWTRIPRLDGGQSVLLAVSREQSLAWKLMWLIEDMKEAGASRGKDLYDAVLLAELPGLRPMKGTLTRAVLDEIQIDWAEFATQYPQAEGTLSGWKQRLADALALA